MGTLRGYDVFMNITMADALEQDPSGEKLAIGTVVIRGNSIVSIEVRTISNIYRTLLTSRHLKRFNMDVYRNEHYTRRIFS